MKNEKNLSNFVVSVKRTTETQVVDVKLLQSSAIKDRGLEKPRRSLEAKGEHLIGDSQVKSLQIHPQGS
jgi:hypothetical protein